MLRLDTTTRKLQAVLAGAITTNQLPILVSWADKSSTDYAGGSTPTNTNSTTAVDICAAPGASTIRDIDYISVRNADTAAATVIIRYNDNGTTYDIYKATLAVGDHLVYVHGAGWQVIDADGGISLSDNNTWTGTNTFRNAAGIRSEQAATQDAIALVGRAGGTGSYEATITPTTLTADRTITVPDASGTMVVNGGSSAIVSASAQASTSGTSIDFTGIPSWVKRITVMFSGVSTNGTSFPLIQLGDAGGVEVTGYSVNGCYVGATSGASNSTTGFAVPSSGASNYLYGQITFALVSASSNTWVGNGGFSITGPYVLTVVGEKPLSATLDRVRITTVNGTDTFDAGTINIMYE